MVFREDLSALYSAFHDRLDDEGKEQKLIKCQICCIEGVPSHSANASICEMCFDDDFWHKMEEVKEDKTDMLWAIKTLSDGLVEGTYFAKGQYLGRRVVGEDVTSVDGLSKAHFYQTKTLADEGIDQAIRLEGKHRPEFTTVQVRLTEVG